MTKEIERIRAALEADTSQDVAMILMREEMVAVLSHIDAQQAEIARLTAEVTRPESTEMTLMRTLAQSREMEIERLRADAARYQWLRDGGIYILPYEDHGAGPEFDLSDSSIDAAMKETS